MDPIYVVGIGIGLWLMFLSFCALILYLRMNLLFDRLKHGGIISSNTADISSSLSLAPGWKLQDAIDRTKENEKFDAALLKHLHLKVEKPSEEMRLVPDEGAIELPGRRRQRRERH